MTVLMAEKKIMSNVSGKIFDQQRTGTWAGIYDYGKCTKRKRFEAGLD